MASCTVVVSAGKVKEWVDIAKPDPDQLMFCPAAVRNSCEPRIWLAVMPKVCEFASPLNWFNSALVAGRFR